MIRERSFSTAAGYLMPVFWINGNHSLTMLMLQGTGVSGASLAKHH